jgi:hypothetical protein
MCLQHPLSESLHFPRQVSLDLGNPISDHFFMNFKQFSQKIGLVVLRIEERLKLINQFRVDIVSLVLQICHPLG